MHITIHTDFALRLLIYLQVTKAEVTTISDVSEAYGISPHHLAKVAQSLTALGWIESRRGRGGGLVLGAETPSRNLGEVIRALEPDALVECHTPSGSCTIAPACKLNRALREGLEAFYRALDQYTLADMAKQKRSLQQLLAVQGS